MKNVTQKFTEEELNEPLVSPNSILAELKPLLDEYFIGEITLDKKCITYSLPNGQRFKLMASEVVL